MAEDAYFDNLLKVADFLERNAELLLSTSYEKDFPGKGVGPSLKRGNNACKVSELQTSAPHLAFGNALHGKLRSLNNQMSLLLDRDALSPSQHNDIERYAVRLDDFRDKVKQLQAYLPESSNPQFRYLSRASLYHYLINDPRLAPQEEAIEELYTSLQNDAAYLQQDCHRLIANLGHARSVPLKYTEKHAGGFGKTLRVEVPNLHANDCSLLPVMYLNQTIRDGQYDQTTQAFEVSAIGTNAGVLYNFLKPLRAALQQAGTPAHQAFAETVDAALNEELRSYLETLAKRYYAELKTRKPEVAEDFKRLIHTMKLRSVETVIAQEEKKIATLRQQKTSLAFGDEDAVWHVVANNQPTSPTPPAASEEAAASGCPYHQALLAAERARQNGAGAER